MSGAVPSDKVTQPAHRDDLTARALEGVLVLGSTGSIGQSTLDVISRHPDKYFVWGLTANRDVDTLLSQCKRHRPCYAVMADEGSAAVLRDRLAEYQIPTQVLGGHDALCTVAAAAEAPIVMAAIVGAAGLMPTLSAVRASKRVLLANKESLVMAGELFMQEVKRFESVILPIDSEHSAIFQSLPSSNRDTTLGCPSLSDLGVRKLLLTASGGPFLDLPLAEFAEVTPEQACAHPNWQMGQKISVDSASMMNKGLELIEAAWLFGASLEQIQIVIHPQSIVHSMVEYLDGSVVAQLGQPDMRPAIAYGLAWPTRIASGAAPVDWMSLPPLTFLEPDNQRFPSLRLAQEALKEGGALPAVLNAANEVAVSAFLRGGVSFTHIPIVIEQVMARFVSSSGMHSHPVKTSLDLDAILTADGWARDIAQTVIATKSTR